MLVKKTAFEKVDGFDTDLPWHSIDIDFCLKSVRLVILLCIILMLSYIIMNQNPEEWKTMRKR